MTLELLENKNAFPWMGRGRRRRRKISKSNLFIYPIHCIIWFGKFDVKNTGPVDGIV